MIFVVWCRTASYCFVHQLLGNMPGVYGGVQTPLMRAAGNNSNPEVIEVLLNADANAKAKDKEGKTALDYAKDNKKIYKTKVYWKLNQLKYE